MPKKENVAVDIFTYIYVIYFCAFTFSHEICKIEKHAIIVHYCTFILYFNRLYILWYCDKIGLDKDCQILF